VGRKNEKKGHQEQKFAFKKMGESVVGRINITGVNFIRFKFGLAIGLANPGFSLNRIYFNK